MKPYKNEFKTPFLKDFIVKFCAKLGRQAAELGRKTVALNKS